MCTAFIHLLDGLLGLDGEALEEEDFERQHLREHEVGRDVLQPAARHAPAPVAEAAPLAGRELLHRRHVSAAAARARLDVQPTLELGPERGDGVPHEQHHLMDTQTTQVNE